MIKEEMGNRCILIVDSNNYTRKLTKEMLRACGVKNIIEAESGAKGLVYFQEFNPDVIILEKNLSDFDGMVVLDRVRSEKSPNRRVPVVMLTFDAPRRNVTESRDTGATEFLVKPISPNTLRERILAVLHKPRDFVQSATYFGPDRRRRRDDNYAGEERRGSRRMALNRQLID